MGTDPSGGFVELSGPDLSETEVDAVISVLRTRRLSLGPKLPEFERAIADYVGLRHGIAVNSGTSALHLIVRALGLGDGDEVITTPFSFVASANCLLYERVTPRFVDIDPSSLNINCDLIEANLTERTRAILAVDVFGLPANWGRLRELAAAHRLALIEDSCEALGARLRSGDGGWTMAGTFADAGTFAFYPNKQITTGEGGMVVTDRDDLAALCRSMRNQGRDEGAEWLAHARLGYNYRLSDINCALGIAQMSRLEEMLAARRRVAGWYREALSGMPGVAAPADSPGAERSWFVYVVRLTRCRGGEQLRAALTALRERGIGCANYFPPIHLQPFYRQLLSHREGDFPVTEEVSGQTLALPFHNRITQAQVRGVAEALRETMVELNLEGPAGAPPVALGTAASEGTRAQATSPGTHEASREGGSA
jgi:perosamine synthetase